MYIQYKSDLNSVQFQNEKLQDELKKQTESLKKAQQELNNHKRKYNHEEFCKLKEENLKVTQRMEELETQNREQAKRKSQFNSLAAMQFFSFNSQ